MWLPQGIFLLKKIGTVQRKKQTNILISCACVRLWRMHPGSTVRSPTHAQHCYIQNLGGYTHKIEWHPGDLMRNYFFLVFCVDYLYDYLEEYYFNLSFVWCV